ncbi:GMC oxidoreductase [Apiospora kogelbergensis]|uniref:GMC oxidoreductase n=1 Tax=Apiospora kogelbergensis TaxID=1337665 RepID=A0AAW0QYP4_9PEZI
MLYTGSASGSRGGFSSISLSPISRGSITLASTYFHNAPLIDPNYLATAVDRCIYREGVRKEVAVVCSTGTLLGREILDGEAQLEELEKPYTASSTDEYIDARIRAAVRSVHHPMGTAAMRKVVDTNLRIRAFAACASSMPRSCLSLSLPISW